ncbi:sigma-70 family RNA polymerase sigma factor [Saccharopolyspora gloriosae]|uniref:sigma-70 family RNA polymerase sigma factor n=1 Tax=Saccharopolyspora gloriosae TaxID=455344 RepID=UPI001FB82F87|nr:sigma-70 family RNA polymerase sigma factor [Saccharopolyspora gloriosae]
MLTSTLPAPVHSAAHRHAHLPGRPPAAAPQPLRQPEPAEARPEPESSTEEPAPGANWRHVSAAQNGDNDAFGKLYDEYAHVVYRYVLFRVSDHCLAEDITSETFLRALRRIATVSYQGRDVAAWFITIAKNLVLDHVKSSRTRLEVPIPELTDAQHRPQAQCGPEQHVLDAATQQELLRCIRQLNADQRECIKLRFMQGLSVTETAQRMHRGEGAIKALQHRAVRRLAQLLPDDLR